MSLRTLPEIPDIAALKRGETELQPAALERWRPALRAAADDEEATISIYDVIGDSSFGEGFTVRRLAAILRNVGARALTVNINSPGGDYFEGNAIYNALRAHKAAVTVRVMGLAASAASLIAMAGDRIEVARSAFLMVHNAWGVVVGDRNALRDAADTLEPFDRAMRDVYAARSGQAAEEVAAMMDRTTFIAGGEAVEKGFADALLASDEIAETEDASARSLSARARIERALMNEGMTRAERRALLKEFGGTPGAAAAAMPGAGVELAASLRRLAETITRGQ